MTLDSEPTPPRRRLGPSSSRLSSFRLSSAGVGWILLALGMIGTIVVGLTPAPYVVEKPGPVFDTLGKVDNSGKRVELIDIPTAKTYSTTGSLDMLTVNLVGSPEQPLTWVDVAAAWFDPSKAVTPTEYIYAPGETTKESNAEDAAEMADSQHEAVAAALRNLGYSVPAAVAVQSVLAGSAADGTLKAGDRILEANGSKVSTSDDLRKIIHANGVDKAIVFEIQRGSLDTVVNITPQIGDDGSGDKVPLVGIIPSEVFTYPVNVKIQLQNVGGPSAGMMFALGIIDKLTPGSLTGGEHIAGTGTIDASGTVGAIGGIVQKMYGARDAGAKWFLAPSSNCADVRGHVPSGLTVYSVSTLSQAKADVKAIAKGSGLGQLATCSRT